MYTRFEIVQIRDSKAEEKLSEEIAMRKRNMPFGNPEHPECKEVTKMEDKLKAGIERNQYRAYLPDGSFHALRPPEYKKLVKEATND